MKNSCRLGFFFFLVCVKIWSTLVKSIENHSVTTVAFCMENRAACCTNLYGSCFVPLYIWHPCSEMSKGSPLPSEQSLDSRPWLSRTSQSSSNYFPKSMSLSVLQEPSASANRGKEKQRRILVQHLVMST